MVTTDNDLFNKIVTVLAVLCDETHELEATARETFCTLLIEIKSSTFHNQQCIV